MATQAYRDEVRRGVAVLSVNSDHAAAAEAIPTIQDPRAKKVRRDATQILEMWFLTLSYDSGVSTG